MQKFCLDNITYMCLFWLFHETELWVVNMDDKSAMRANSTEPHHRSDCKSGGSCSTALQERVALWCYVIFRELRAKVCSLSTKVEKLGKLDTKLKSAFYACQTLEDVEHLVRLVISIASATSLLSIELKAFEHFLMKMVNSLLLLI